MANPKSPYSPHSPAAMQCRIHGEVAKIGSDIQYERAAAIGTHTAILQHLVEDLG